MRKRLTGFLILLMVAAPAGAPAKAPMAPGTDRPYEPGAATSEAIDADSSSAAALEPEITVTSTPAAPEEPAPEDARELMLADESADTPPEPSLEPTPVPAPEPSVEPAPTPTPEPANEPAPISTPQQAEQRYAMPMFATWTDAGLLTGIVAAALLAIGFGVICVITLRKLNREKRSRKGE